MRFIALLIACSGAILHAQDYATFLGGFSSGYGTEHAFAIAADASGHAYVGGGTAATPFPATRRYGTNDGGGFIVKLSPDGSRMVYSTFFESIEIVAVRWSSSEAVYALGHTGGPQAAINLGQYAGGYSDAVVLKLGGQGELLWARYLGGSDLEVPRAMTLDAAGNVCVAGITTSTNFPATAQAVQKSSQGGFEGFVAKFDPTGAIVFASYLGGPGDEFIHSLAAHSTGHLVMGGVSSSPALAGFSPTATHGPLGGTDAFVAGLRADGAALEWLSFIGGSGRDAVLAVEDHQTGAIAMLGSTTSPNFPVTPGVLQTNLAGNSDLWLARVAPDGAQLLGATYLGSIESEDVGDPFWASFILDGEQQERHLFPENAGFAVGAGGTLLVAARNNSPIFPAWGSQPVSFGGNREAFFARVAPNLASLLDLKFLGGATDDEARALTVAPSGNILIVGTIYSPSVPPFFAVTPGAVQTNFAGGAMDGFVVRIPDFAPPALEDSFASPRPLAGQRSSAVSRIDSATRETGEPAHAPEIQKTLWFSWHAPGNGRLVASTAGSSFPAGVAVYSGASLSSLALLGLDLQSSDLLDHSRVMVSVSAGAEYRIAILGRAEDAGMARISTAFSEPLNDDFAGALLLSGLPASAAAANVNATAEPSEGAHHESIPSRSLWWKWIAPDDRSVAISTAGSDFDTVLAIYTGNSLNALERVASNDDSSDGANSEAVFLPQTGRTYFIAVDGQRDQHGSVKLRIVSNDPPPNDNFAARAPLAGAVQNVVASNLRATLEPGEPGLQFTNILNEVDPYFSRATVWWSWQSPRAGRLRLDTIGSDFDTRLGLYTGESLASLVRVSANDDIDRALEQRASRLELDVAEGARFAIQVDGSLGSPAGVVRLNLRLFFPPRILAGTLRRAGNALNFEAEGVSEEAYQVETSSDLKNWSPVGDFVPESAGAWRFSVPASHPRQLFIRLASRP